MLAAGQHGLTQGCFMVHFSPQLEYKTSPAVSSQLPPSVYVRFSDYIFKKWKKFKLKIILKKLAEMIYLLMDLFSEFAKEKDRVESRAGFLLLKEEQKLEKEMNGYMNWICKAG